jgi:hypothetical protein
MSDVQQAAGAFAQEATRFQRWARVELDEGGASAGLALMRVTRLYLAALLLPPPWGDGRSCASVECVDDAEWRLVYTSAGRLPVDDYGEQFDPLVVPPDEPTIGRLSDDIADIYRDVVSGLRDYEAGRHSEAVGAWAFGFRHHWGAHATGAIRALHAWLTQNVGDHTPWAETNG